MEYLSVGRLGGRGGVSGLVVEEVFRGESVHMIEDEKVGDEVLMIGTGQARCLRLSFPSQFRLEYDFHFLTLPMLGTLLSHAASQ